MTNKVSNRFKLYYDDGVGIEILPTSYTDYISFKSGSYLPDKGFYLILGKFNLWLNLDLDYCLGLESDGDIKFLEQTYYHTSTQILGYINRLFLKTTEAFLG